jgi:Resolvase, N terminal domain
MDDARKRKFDVIVVWRFDRFARSTKHLLVALEEFRSLGIQFISYRENIDTRSALGQALFTIVSAVAQLERDLIRERVTAGIRNARANGKQLGRPKRTIDRDEILKLQSQGHSLRRIATAPGRGLWDGAYPAGEPGELKNHTNILPGNGPNRTLSGAASHGPKSADCGSGACGRGRVLADEDTAYGWWFGNGLQSLGVRSGSFGRGLTVREAAGPLENGVSGAADFVEERLGCPPRLRFRW